MKKMFMVLAVLLSVNMANASAGLSDIFDGISNSFGSSGSKKRSVRESFPVVVLQGKYKPIILQQLHISVKVTGPIARTSYEMVFFNPNNRVLEGELKLPLLDGEKVVGYALDMNGEYRESVIVDKAKAKQAFEDIVRQSVDPGIIEKTVGNNYKLRLYPLPAKGTKKIKVTVEEILHSRSGLYRYRLPFVSNRKIPKFSMKIEISNPNIPTVKLSGLIEKEHFEHSQKGYFLQYHKSKMRLNKPLILSMEKSNNAGVYFQKETKKHSWFMVLFPKPKSEKNSLSPPKASETIGIVWNTSLSNLKRNREKEFAFLDRYFKTHKETTFTVRLTTIDIKNHARGTFKVVNGEWKALKNALKSIRYNGATDLSKLKYDRDMERVFFFSNGLNTFSEEIHVSKKVPVVTVVSTGGSDTDTLKYIAYKSSGIYLDLLRTDIDDAVAKLENLHALKTVRSSHSVTEVYVKDLGEEIAVFGKRKGDGGTVAFRLNGEKYRVSVDKGIPSDLIARVWAGQKLEALLMNRRHNKKKIVALSRRYRIVTRYTSMMVLERVEDYVRYEVIPPISLRKEYYALLQQTQSKKKNEKKEAIEEAVRLLEEQKQWYRMKFPLSLKDFDGGEAGGDIAPVEALAAPAPRQRTGTQKKNSRKPNAGLSQPRIALKAWESDAAYLKGLDAISKKRLSDRYYRLRQVHYNEPSFYIDMADYFRKRGLKKEAIVILSNLLELDLENSEFIRVFAFKLQEYHWYTTALYFFQKVQVLRPFEPQSTRDLALAYERVGKYQKALDLHYSIIVKNWNGRFSGTKIVTLNEMNHLIMKHRLNTSRIDRRLIARMPVDIRIVINWSTDNTDMDLWVIDPEKVKTYYGNRISKNGGKISNDMTRGYGPEEFMLKKALRGAYEIKVKYFGTSQQKLTGPTIIRAEVYTHYGKKNEKREDIVFRVDEEKEVVDLGKIVY